MRTLNLPVIHQRAHDKENRKGKGGGGIFTSTSITNAKLHYHLIHRSPPFSPFSSSFSYCSLTPSSSTFSPSFSSPTPPPPLLLLPFRLQATIYASTGQKSTPAVSAAAKAFASAGASAVSDKQNVSVGPGASKGSEMATGTTTTTSTTTTTTATTATTLTTATTTTTLPPTSETAAGDFYLFGGGTGDHPAMMPYAPPVQ